MNFMKKFEHNGNTYALAFTLNVMEEIQEEFGSFEAWAELCDGNTETGDGFDARAIKLGLTSMINEGIDIMNEEEGTNRALLTPRQVGRLITGVGFMNAVQLMQETVVESTKDEEKNE